jgi:hypothetical protein
VPEDLIKIILPVILGALGGITSAVVTARFKENEERAKNQLQYLNPLRVSAMDLQHRLSIIEKKRQSEDPLLISTLDELETKIKDPEDFVIWANGRGEFALSALYVTLVYFARAGTIRTELPFVQLSAGDDDTLLGRLERVRRALGGEYGIWVDLQDSLGSYMRRTKGGLLSYREFCTELSQPSSFPWFHKVVGFYRELHLKKPDERKEMTDSLDCLVQFLADKPKETASGS